MGFKTWNGPISKPPRREFGEVDYVIENRSNEDVEVMVGRWYGEDDTEPDVVGIVVPKGKTKKLRANLRNADLGIILDCVVKYPTFYKTCLIDTVATNISLGERKITIGDLDFEVDKN